MKKALKVIGISAGSIIGVALVAVCIVVYLVFTPAKLTPIVKKYIPEFVTCQTQLDTVDLTFFSTFPHFGLRLHNFALVNPMEGAPSDTVAFVEELVATVDVKEYLDNENIVINGIYLSNTQANIFVNANSVANYDVFVSDTTSEEDTSSTSLFKMLKIEDIELKNISASYVDLPSKMQATIRNINATTNLTMENDDIVTDLSLGTGAVSFTMNDSTNIQATIDSIEGKFNGGLANLSNINGTLQLFFLNTAATMDNVKYADSLNISAVLPMVADLDSMKIALTNALIGINEHQISLTGNAQVGDDITMDMNFSTNNIILNRLLPLIPENMRKEYLDGINLDGVVQLSGNVAGTYNDTLMPIISADAVYSNGEIVIEGLGHDLYDVSVNAHANVDMNDEKNSILTLNALSAKTGKTSVTATGAINDLLNKMLFDIKANAKIYLLDLKSDLPDYLFASGWADAAFTAQCSLDDLMNVDLQKIKANGSVDITDLDVIYEDSTFVNSKQMAVDFTLPSKHTTKEFKEVIDLAIKSNQLNVEMTDFFKTKLNNADLRVGLSDVMDTTKDMALACDFNIANVVFNMEADTISATIRNPRGMAVMYPKNKNTGYGCLFNCDSLSAKVAETLSARTGLISFDAKAEYDSTAADVIQQWNPDVKLNFNQGQIALSAIEAPIKVSKIKCDFNKNRLKIDDSQLIVGNSDFSLKGVLKNIAAYLNNEDLLLGDFTFTSNYTDVMELMDLASGFGDTTTVAETNEIAKADTVEEDNPFMVPLGVDFTLKTDIKKALVGNTIVEHAGGGVTIHDGVLVIEEMGFTCDAAQMQLTAMYRSERKNHLFAGLDFHLIDISINDLIDMIPDIDTIVPMLKAFSGKAEFHLAAETYLKSNYDPKFSTMRGAAAIKGRDLVVMDNETYQQISKLLLFNKKKTKNVIDSLNVEMTMFRNEVDLYPFVVSMDKYQAILSGYHNLDMTYNYHISLTKCPLPMRLGLNIYGNMDDLKFKLAKCKYRRLYKPKQQGVVDEQILSLKKIISSSIRAGVKDQGVLIKD
ncbi:MAG: AsmA family protein [Bacteroidales bacterium]|nr:AsmA family protein [Bacteroidales bacterium]